ncbi:hypothetical protein EBB_18225 [Methylomonas sp. EbB]|uniref:Uncharacterized protein n=1 Tax=Methylomonas fluvii TaxID=1854564 RepID=A0ABR9DHY0_9GAMM|nr:hypothetical protein [Methylomonas fluvii]
MLRSIAVALIAFLGIAADNDKTDSIFTGSHLQVVFVFRSDITATISLNV